MPRRDPDPDFIESIARGFDVIKAFDERRPVMSLTEVATAAQLARPTGCGGQFYALISALTLP